MRWWWFLCWGWWLGGGGRAREWGKGMSSMGGLRSVFFWLRRWDVMLIALGRNALRYGSNDGVVMLQLRERERAGGEQERVMSQRWMWV